MNHFAKKPANAPANARRFFVVNGGKIAVIFGVPKSNTVTSFDGNSRVYQIGTNAFSQFACAQAKLSNVRKPFLAHGVNRRLITAYA